MNALIIFRHAQPKYISGRRTRPRNGRRGASAAKKRKKIASTAQRAGAAASQMGHPTGRLSPAAARRRDDLDRDATSRERRSPVIFIHRRRKNFEPWPVKLSRLSGSVRHCQGDCQASVKASVKIHCQQCQASVRPLSSDLDRYHAHVLSRLSSRPLSGCQGCQALSGAVTACLPLPGGVLGGS